MPKKWKCYTSCSVLQHNSDFKMGFCYAVKIPIVQGFSLIKIGATGSPKSRLTNIGKKGTIFCISPPHLNFWQNEEILHEKFSKFRVPARPGKGVQAEFFNINLKYFFEHLPEMSYEVDYSNLSPINTPHNGTLWVKK